jgi:hypothetical protein
LTFEEHKIRENAGAVEIWSRGTEIEELPPLIRPPQCHHGNATKFSRQKVYDRCVAAPAPNSKSPHHKASAARTALIGNAKKRGQILPSTLHPHLSIDKSEERTGMGN